ncbi:1,2-phenylacetyl-CoA epoxidase subunit PaaD [Alicyclobacillus contaminans]|uniref:1,2-phenylacetyl-CoA epoxidase subunit PaaD n=1 Tax=Alicyclobacillus contaminans TaxID=392016 RepID=UPI0006861291|nr:1,2-phenylacetyl-CoA epoxidase subunit PaaD [Alicyclobacillus contaminans]
MSLASLSDDVLASVWGALDDVKDPEIPAVSIRELGMVRQVCALDGRIRVELLPTFVGCPALDWIRRSVERQVAQVLGRDDVDVVFVFDEPWTSARITPQGIEKLLQFGIAPPVVSNDSRLIPPCPYCGAESGEVENLFGPTPCRAIFYCHHCKQPFEGMKPL